MLDQIDSGPPSPRWTVGKRLLVLLLMFSMTVTSGCGGCRKKNQTAQQKKADEEKEEKKKKKKAYQSKRPFVVPTDDEEGNAQLNAIKPGHWTTVTQQMISNEKDTQVEIQSSVLDNLQRSSRIDNTAYELVSTRSAAMPKERIREFESLFYIPRDTKNRTLRNRVIDRKSGATLIESMRPSATMPAYQYYVVVLSREPDRLKFIKRLPSFESQATLEDGTGSIVYNRVAYLQPDAKTLPLPSHALTWTSISTLVWDRIDPARLTPPQKDALLDWLHWGGRLIISGPGSLERLRGSFLEPHLPATREAAVELDAEAIAPFNQAWSVPGKGHQITLKEGQVIVGIELATANNGYFLEDSASLLAEGQVGRGGIIVTAFSLFDRAVTNWPSYDSFFNGCLLRRPAREFGEATLDAGAEIRVNTRLGTQDARLISNLRYFSRDTPQYGDRSGASGRLSSSWATDPVSGVAGWNDQSGTAVAARLALRDAAGISIPRVGFVLRTLGLYLAVLVPLNWLVFRLIGRVEWAWVAAPVIAIAGSVAVVRLAELDIGFASSRTEIATLEFHGGHSRGHLSRYNALYSSLASRYKMIIDEADALAQPFATGDDYVPGAYDTIHQVKLRRGRTMELNGFRVGSNTTGMVHSEQMVEMGGAFDLIGNESDGWKVRNDSTLSIRDVGLLRYNANGEREAAWIGELKTGQTKPVRFEPIEPRWKVEPWRKVATFQRSIADDGQLRLRSLWSIATDQLALEPLEIRLVGWHGQLTIDLVFAPAASQVRSQTLVVGHFWTGRLPRPDRDANLPPKQDLGNVPTLQDRDLLPLPPDGAPSESTP